MPHLPFFSPFLLIQRMRKEKESPNERTPEGEKRSMNNKHMHEKRECFYLLGIRIILYVFFYP